MTPELGRLALQLQQQWCWVRAVCSARCGPLQQYARCRAGLCSTQACLWPAEGVCSTSEAGKGCQAGRLRGRASFPEAKASGLINLPILLSFHVHLTNLLNLSRAMQHTLFAHHTLATGRPALKGPLRPSQRAAAVSKAAVRCIGAAPVAAAEVPGGAGGSAGAADWAPTPDTANNAVGGYRGVHEDAVEDRRGCWVRDARMSRGRVSGTAAVWTGG